MHDESETSLKPVRVLLVEDDQGHVALMSRAFRTRAPHVILTTAGTLRDAQEHLAQGPPDLLITDLLLPDGRGTELLPGSIDRAAFPAVVMTGFGNEEAAAEAIRSGAMDYVVKSDATLTDMPHLADRVLQQWTGVVERARMEKELRASEELYRTLFESANDAILLMEDDRFLDCNAKTLEIFGCTREQIVGQTPFRFSPPRQPDGSESRQSGMRWIAETLQGKSQFFEWRHCRYDGTGFDAEVSLNHIDVSHGRLLLAMVRDVTERVRAGEKLRRMETQLAHVARLSAMGEMVAGIAHEVSQPLYAVINFAKASRNVLSDEKPKDLAELRQWNEEIAAAASRANEIIKRLRSFARPAEVQRSPAEINEVVEESVQLMAFETRRRQVVVDLELSETVPAVYVDRVQIQQVLVNLLRNACEAMEDPSLGRRRIVVRTCLAGESDSRPAEATADEFVEVSVRDSGPGLPPDESLKLFEPFVTTKPEGMGMGLAISTSIVEAHGGRLWATADRGATFHFTLPPVAKGQSDAR